MRVVTLVLSLLATVPARDEAVVPAVLQAELLARMLRYDRAFQVDAGARVSVLVVHRTSAQSESVGRQLAAALGTVDTVGGIAHQEVLVPFSTVDALVKTVETTGSRVVVFAPGFAADARAIVDALDGRKLMTVSSTPRGVEEGLVLGFDLVDGKPRMLFNLTSSRRQKADFRAEVIKLMTVVQ